MIDLFLAPYQNYTSLDILLEIIAAIFGIASVFLAAKKNILVYPTGIISTSIYVYLLFCWGIYADAVINIYYTFMSIFGWFMWKRSFNSSSEEILKISFLKSKAWFFTILFSLVNFFIFFIVLSRYTDSTIPFVDSLTTAIAFSAMYLMAKKKVENWIFWIVCDIISIPLYIYKGYFITSLQYVVFLILAIYGLVSWIQTFKREHKC